MVMDSSIHHFTIKKTSPSTLNPILSESKIFPNHKIINTEKGPYFLSPDSGTGDEIEEGDSLRSPENHGNKQPPSPSLSSSSVSTNVTFGGSQEVKSSYSSSDNKGVLCLNANSQNLSSMKDCQKIIPPSVPEPMVTSINKQNNKGNQLYTLAFNLNPLQSSLLGSCGGGSVSCETLSGPCASNSELDYSTLFKHHRPFSIYEGQGKSDDFSKEKCSSMQPNTSTNNSNIRKSPSNSRFSLTSENNLSDITEVVRNQPHGIQSPNTQYVPSCTCINPGTSHACAARTPLSTPTGVLNPLFDAMNVGTDFDFKEKSDTRMVKTPSTPGHYDLPLMPVVTSVLTSPFQPVPFQASSMLNCSDQPVRTKIVPTNMAYVTPVDFKANYQYLQDSDIGRSILTPEESMPGAIGLPGPLKVTSPDWFSFLSPSLEPSKHKLFTPDDLRDELMYPNTYAFGSKVFQNHNAKEADFVLQRPNRKPRTEPLPSLQMKNKKESSGEGLIEPLAMKEDKAIGGDLGISIKKDETHCNSNKDNFNRYEYVSFKRTLNQSEPSLNRGLQFNRSKNDSLESLRYDSSTNRKQSLPTELLLPRPQGSNTRNHSWGSSHDRLRVKDIPLSKISPVQETEETNRYLENLTSSGYNSKDTSFGSKSDVNDDQDSCRIISNSSVDNRLGIKQCKVKQNIIPRKPISQLILLKGSHKLNCQLDGIPCNNKIQSIENPISISRDTKNISKSVGNPKTIEGLNASKLRKRVSKKSNKRTNNDSACGVVNPSALFSPDESLDCRIIQPNDLLQSGLVRTPSWQALVPYERLMEVTSPLYPETSTAMSTESTR
ncbi:unnamed protein product, partial [Meganyctiphanes norvegica]